MQIAGIEIPSDSPAFLSILAIHIPLGLVAVVSGLFAMLAPKRRGRHTRFGTVYFWSLCVLFATSAALAAMRWAEDYYLFFLGAIAFSAVLVGRTARRQRWRTHIDFHAIAMGISYIAMLTAFYVDNGKSLPLWRDLPYIAFWILPSAVGIPLIVWVVAREMKPAIRAETAH